MNSTTMMYKRCLSYEFVRDGKNDCFSSVDEKILIKNCSHKYLFLCKDQSRCLPRSLQCNQVINCIDGSDEIEGCNYTSIYFRHLKNNKAFLHNWQTFLRRYTDFYGYFTKVAYLDHEHLIKKGVKFAQSLLFGIKCRTMNENGTSTVYKTVPQPVNSSSETHCYDQEDACFDNVRNLTCFRCFDGTIILKRQVCDGVLDCRDFSDECPCEQSKTWPLCETFYNANKIIKFDIEFICDFKIDLIGGIDEKYCDTGHLFRNEAHGFRNSDHICAKGPTAFNRTLHVVPGENKDYAGLGFNEIFYEVGKFHNYKPKTLNSLSDSHGTCNRKFECPFREDECSPGCFNTIRFYDKEYAVIKFIKCFSFLFNNSKEFLVTNDNEFYFTFWFKNLVLFPFNDLYVYQPIHYRKMRYNIIVDIKDGVNRNNVKLIFQNKLQNISFSFNQRNVLKTCKDNLLDCPWYFRCESDTYELIEIKKACDFNFDCKDQSDEKYCSSTTHFNCTAGNIVSIDRSKVNDDEFDCEDRSDECSENPISSVKEMIKNIYLRKFMWITLVGIIVLNIFVMKNNYKNIKKIDDDLSTKYYNLVFILNLSFSDIIFGIVLSVIAFSSSKFSGVYCTSDFKWRSSTTCEVLGVLTFISSQTSLNILVLLTGFRLYTVYKPFKSLEIKKYKIYTVLFICWVSSFILAIIPLVLKKEFMQKIIISNNIFLNNKKFDRIIKPNELYGLAKNIENIWSASKPNSIPASQSVYKVRDFKDWYFNSEKLRSKYPNTSIVIKKTFGFYGSSAVCLPDFYSKSPVSSKFSFALMSFNLFLIVCVSLGYILIFYKIKSRKSVKPSKTDPKKENTMLFRISLIIATDIACWLPIIAFSFASFFGYQIPDIVHSLTSIVLLPINSLLNPVLYSRIDTTLIRKMNQAISMARKQFA